MRALDRIRGIGLLILGFFSLCQSIFLPGYLAKRLLRIETNSWLQTIIYVFALSLLTNYMIVVGLYFAGLYTTFAMKLLIVVECFALILVIRQNRKNSTMIAATNTEKISPPLLLIPSLAFVLWFTWLLISSFGSSFTYGDDAGLWDLWATEWARSIPHSLTYEYPQLLPGNWSISYLLLQHPDVKMFAKAIMPLFSLATLLTFLDLFNQTHERKWLWSLIFYSLILRYFYESRFLVSGYAELPSAFFAFLTYYATTQVDCERAPRKFLNYLVPLIFASAAALTKQSGLYILCWVLVWLVIRLWQNFKNDWLLKTVQSSFLAVALNAWYPYQHWRIICGQDQSNVGYLYKLVPVPLRDRLSHSFSLLQTLHTGESALAGSVTVTLVASSLTDKQARLVLFTLFLPIYIGWAIGFSYETRTLGIALPFLAMCLGCGAAAVLAFPHFCATQPHSGLKLFAKKHVTLISALLICFIVTFSLKESLCDGASWTRDVINEMALPCLFSLFAFWLLKKRSPPPLLNHLRVSPIVLLIISLAMVAIVLFGLQNSMLNDDAVVRQQRENRKLIGDALLNKELYQTIRSGRIKGTIVTCYSPLELLPDISQYYTPYHGDFRTVKRLDVEHNIRISKASYMLMPNQSFSTETKKWMDDAGFSTIFQLGEWSLIAFPVKTHLPAH